MEHILRNVLMALLEQPDATLHDVLRIFSDSEFRKRIAKSLRNDIVRTFLLKALTVSSIAISGTISAVARCMKRGTPRGGPPDEIVRHSSRKCSNSQHQWLCAKYSGSGTGSQAGTTDGRPAANQRSKNNYGQSSHRCARCWVAVWSKRRRHRQSEPRSRTGGNSGRREQASR
jgi:hypothetical protein